MSPAWWLTSETEIASYHLIDFSFNVFSPLLIPLYPEKTNYFSVCLRDMIMPLSAKLSPTVSVELLPAEITF